jgi:hypothetical protein
MGIERKAKTEQVEVVPAAPAEEAVSETTE